MTVRLQVFASRSPPVLKKLKVPFGFAQGSLSIAALFGMTTENASYSVVSSHDRCHRAIVCLGSAHGTFAFRRPARLRVEIPLFNASGLVQ